MADAFRSTIVYMETMGDRLRAARIGAKLSQEQLGDAVGKTKQGISQIETGTTKSPEAITMEGICRKLKLNLRWLMTGKGPKEALSQAEAGEWDDILGYAQAAGLGSGQEVQEYAETHRLKFRADSLRRKGLIPESLGVMYGKGDSMLPHIKTGDAILFNTQQTAPEDEALFVILVPGVNANEYSVKRCRHFGDDIYFDALNPEGDHHWRKPRRMDDKKKPIQIIGRVRWIGSWED